MSEHQYTRVGDVMTPKPHVIDGLATVRETIDLMRREQVSSVIVDRRHKGDEYGIVVVYDIAVEIVGKDRSPERTNVYEIMSKPVVAVEADMDEIKAFCEGD